MFHPGLFLLGLINFSYTFDEMLNDTTSVSLIVCFPGLIYGPQVYAYVTNSLQNRTSANYFLIRNHCKLEINLDELKNNLINLPDKGGEKVVEEWTELIDDYLLGLDESPDPIINLIYWVLSDSKIFNKQGVWQFLFLLSVNNNVLKDAYFQKLKNIFLDHFSDYSEDMMCHMTNDFVASQYKPKDALNILIKLREAEKDLPSWSTHIGFSMLATCAPKGSSEEQKAIELGRQIISEAKLKR